MERKFSGFKIINIFQLITFYYEEICKFGKNIALLFIRLEKNLFSPNKEPIA